MPTRWLWPSAAVARRVAQRSSGPTWRMRSGQCPGSCWRQAVAAERGASAAAWGRAVGSRQAPAAFSSLRPFVRRLLEPVRALHAPCGLYLGPCRYAWQEVEGDTSGDAKTRLADAAKDLLKEQLVRRSPGQRLAEPRSC